MGRTPCCPKVGVNKGAWCAQEDQALTAYINANGEGKWTSLPEKAGLNRCGKSCRLRWINYLKPGIKRGGFTEDEDDLLIKLHNLLGNRWALIAGRLPGRTDNEIKNYWNTTLSKKAKKNTTSNTNLTHYNGQQRSPDHRRNGDHHVVHYAKASRGKNVVLPASLQTSQTPSSEDQAGDQNNGVSGGSGSSLFQFSPEEEYCGADLPVGLDFEDMPDCWSADLEHQMTAFLDFKVDEWGMSIIHGTQLNY